MVRVVAITPTTPVFVAAAAGLIAGSMPMIGISNVSRIVLTPSAVAVLQETTIALAPLEIRKRPIARHRSFMYSEFLSPYGA